MGLSDMMLRMAEVKQKPRFTESLPGRMAGWLLAALWIYSMSGIDSHSFSAYPACVLMPVVLLLAGVGILAGYRLVRMSGLGWFTLAAAGYFLIRCVNSYAVTDSYEDEAIILGGIVYYVAGLYVAQNRRYSSLFFVLGLALVLNMVAYWATKQPWFCLEWTGRALETPEGCNHIPTSLFIYKNFAGFFLVTAGLALGSWSLWSQKGAWRVICLVVSMGAVVLSFFCKTRVPYVMLPVALVIMWGLDLMIQLYSGRKPGWAAYLAGFIFLVMFLIGCYDLLFGNTIGSLFSSADSHARYLFWSSVCEVIPHTPAWGCGAGATEWEIIPFSNTWSLPNYAHNDYLQVWVDYGIIGIVLVFVLIVSHAVQLLRCIASEQVDIKRRALVAAAFIVVLLLAVYAAADFPWHSHALVCMGAFACGILASPFPHERGGWFSSARWTPGSPYALVEVKAQHWPGKSLLLVMLVALATINVDLGGLLHHAWHAQWEFNRLSREGVDSRWHARRAVIAALMPHYPCPALMDVYFLTPLYETNYAEQESLLRIALQGNPKQLFMSVMLADVLDKQLKFVEAEKLFREKYVGEAMPATCLGAWSAYYAHHLLQWGRHEMKQGNLAKAVSLIEYALNIHKVRSISFVLLYRPTKQTWLKDRSSDKRLRSFVKDSRADLRLMKQIGIQPDDSWQEPLEPGGRPSLYRSWVKKADQ